MSQLKKGAILNYLTIILTNVVGIILTPIIIRKIGDAEYGIYATIGALVATISVLDFGLNNTIIRFVAKYRAEKNKKEEENFLAITLLIYFFISTIVVIIGTLFYNGIDSYYSNMTTEQLEIAKKMFIILIANLAISLPGGTFKGICLGYEQFVFPKIINIIRYISRALLIITILTFGGRAISIVILDTILNFIIIIATMIFVFKKLKVKIKLHQYNFSKLKTIFSYSFWIFVYAIVAQFQWKAGHIVLGGITVPETLAIYSVGLMLGSYFGAFSSALTGVFLPRATQMTVAKSSSKELTDLMIKIGRISFITLIYILSAFILFGKQFVLLWVGETYSQAWLIALLIMFAYIIPLSQGFTGPLIEAKNKVAFKSIVYLITMGLGTILGYFLALKHQALGMVSGSIIGWVIAQNIMNIYYIKVLKLDIIRFFKELFSKTIITLLIIISFGFFINYIPGNNWFIFLIKCSVYTILFSFIMYKYGMINYEKDLVRNVLNKLSKKR